MKILLINIDSKIPSLPLAKLSRYHKLRGDQVSLIETNPDIVYISCIFRENAHVALEFAAKYPNATIDIGGPGFNLKKRLPPEVEKLTADYDIFDSQYSQDYTTRGCIRKCGFCIVPEKEGWIRIAKHPSEFHEDRFTTCMIMDNNLFAAPANWQKGVFQWFLNNGIKMMSPQGWDARLLTEDRAGYLKDIKHVGPIHFAWDDPSDEPKIMKAIETLKETGFDLHHKITFYVLCGYNTSFEQDLYRCQTLRNLGVQAYAMRYDSRRDDKQLNALARWCNAPQTYWSCKNFSDYTRKIKRGSSQ